MQKLLTVLAVIAGLVVAAFSLGLNRGKNAAETTEAAERASVDAEASKNTLRCLKMLSMFIKILTCSLMLLSLNGCGNAGGVKVIDAGCEWTHPIYISNHDIDLMSGSIQREILKHNETWERNYSKISI